MKTVSDESKIWISKEYWLSQYEWASSNQLKGWREHNAATLLGHHKRNTISSAYSKQPSWLYRSFRFLDSNWDIYSADFGFASVYYFMSQMFLSTERYLNVSHRICLSEKSQKHKIPKGLIWTVGEAHMNKVSRRPFSKNNQWQSTKSQNSQQTKVLSRKKSLKKIKVFEGKLCQAQYQTM